MLIILFLFSDCGSLAPPTDGTVNALVTTYQSEATFSCNTGYTLQGSLTLTCQFDGSWDNTPPTCQINGTESILTLNRGTFNDYMYALMKRARGIGHPRLPPMTIEIMQLPLTTIL